MRRSHLLRANHGERLPVLVICVDTETDAVPIADDAVEAKLRFGWTVVTRRHRGMRWTPERWTRFETPGEFWDAVEKVIHAETRAYLFAHNLGFDFRVLDGFRQLTQRGWELKGAVIDDPPTILRWHQPGRGLICLDTMNYYRTSLKEIGKTFGLDKLEMPKGWGDRERDDAYCRRDTQIVLRAVQGIIRRTRDLDLGNFASTFPALAFTSFRHRHLSTPILIDDNPGALALARSGYEGGRTEAFLLGRIAGPVDVFDVNSMYPWVMHETPMPTVLRGFYRSMTIPELAVETTDAFAVASVTLYTETADFPVVIDGRLLFPVGTFRTVLCGAELTEALHRGAVVKLGDCALYDHAVIFRSYIDEWWTRRLAAKAAGDTAEDDFCKRMMNGLYGKFGQTGRVFETIGPTDRLEARSWTEIDMETGDVFRMRSLGGLLQRQSGEAESRDSHPAIAAAVTSAARMALLGFMNDAGRESVLYVDTDSIFRRRGELPPAFAAHVNGELGGLKHERTISSLTIYGLKDYDADGVRKTKGVRKTACPSGPGSYWQDTFMGLKGSVQSGELDRQIISLTEKHLTELYTKGQVMPDGRILPYRFGG